MPQQIVHLFVFDTLADWEPGFAIAGINDPDFQKEPGRYRVRTVGVSLDPVTTVGGVRILPDITLDQVEPAQSAMLILPGGEAWNQGKHGEAIAKARAFLDAGVPVAAICAAPAALARAGLLDERRHTGNSAEFMASTGYQGGSHYVDAPAVADGDLITAPGTAPVEFAYEIFKRLEVYAPGDLKVWLGMFKPGVAGGGAR
jgi:putative intracellular protease/amidase